MDRHSFLRPVSFALTTILAIAVQLPFNVQADEGSAKTTEKHLLRYQFQKGQTVRFEVVTKSKINSQFNGAKESVYNESRAQRSFEVKSVDDEGNADLVLSIDKVWMSAKFNNAEPTVFDSEDKDKQPKQFKNILETVGRPLSRVKMSATGEMLKALRIDAKGPMSDDATRNLNFLMVLPKVAVAVGDKWYDEMKVQVPIDQTLKKTVRVKRTYELTAFDNGKATIALKTAILTPIRDPAVQGRVIQMKPSGTLVFDNNAGVLVSRTTTVKDSVIGAFGVNSIMAAETDRSEKLLEVERVASDATDSTPVK